LRAMKLLWRSRVEAAMIEEAPPEPSGPKIEIYSSPGLEEALAGIPADGSCKVLDLGPSVAANVEFVSAFASYLQVIDAIDRGPSASGTELGGFGRLSAVNALVDEHRRSFQLVLAWDVFNYLSAEQAERLNQSVAELCLPGARLHAIFFATDTMPAVPNRAGLAECRSCPPAAKQRHRLPPQRNKLRATRIIRRPARFSTNEASETSVMSRETPNVRH